MLIHFGNNESGERKPARCLDSGHLEGMLEVVSINTYPRTKIAFTAAGLTEYVGYNKNASASSADTSWIVTKFAYDASSRNIDSQTFGDIAWDNITATSWDI